MARNQIVQDPLNLGRIFFSGYWTTREQTVPELYRPLVILTFALNHAAGGLRPPGYHLVNILLHAGVCLLLFRLVTRLGGTPFLSWSAALLFAVHPIHTEAVAPVVGRSESLAAAFFLSALILHRRYRTGTSGALRLGGAAACFLAGLLCKEHVIAFPLAALLIDLLFPVATSVRRRPRPGTAYLAYLAVLAAYLALRVAVLGAVAKSVIDPLDNPIVTASFGVAKLTALAALSKGVGLLLWPVHLSADYSFAQVPLVNHWNDPRLAGALAVLLVGSALTLLGWRRSRMVAFAVLFSAITYLPVSNLLFPIGTLLGERLLYLPSLGLCLVVALGLGLFRKKQPAFSVLILGVLLVTGSLRTMVRNGDWQDEARFTLATAHQSPRSAKAQQNLGVFWEDRGDPGQAEIGYRAAARLAPDWADAHYNLAGLLGRTGRVEEAISEYRQAIRLKPAVLPYRLNLGYLLYRSERYGEAVSLYRETIQVAGESAPLQTNLGAALSALGRTEEAIVSHRRAVALEPANPDYQRNLGELLVRQGTWEEGLKWLRSAVRLRPSADLQAALGISLLEADRIAEAVAALSRAAREDPSNPRYHYHLARALQASGKLGEAEAEFRKVLNLTPDAPPPLRDLGLLLAGQGRREEAISLLERARGKLSRGLDVEAQEVLDRLRSGPPSR